jgi:hypothetical protein
MRRFAIRIVGALLAPGTLATGCATPAAVDEPLGVSAGVLSGRAAGSGRVIVPKSAALLTRHVGIVSANRYSAVRSVTVCTRILI